jgi:hypothetical protein
VHALDRARRRAALVHALDRARRCCCDAAAMLLRCCCCITDADGVCDADRARAGACARAWVQERGGPRACGEGSAGCAHRPSSCPAVRSEPGTSDAYSSTRRDKSDVTSRHLEQANDQARNSSPLRPQVRPGSPRRAAPRHLALPEHYLPRRRWQRRRPSVRGCLHR